MRGKGEEENESSALFWGSLHNIRVGVSVCERLQNVCVRAQLWVSECGLLHHLRCLRMHVCFMCAPRFVSGCALHFALRANMLHKNTTHTHLCVCVCACVCVCGCRRPWVALVSL